MITKEKLHRAFLKWAGGKGQLVNQIFSLVPPEHSGRLIEPFVGSGILTLNAQENGFREMVIADTNDALAAIWCQLKWNSRCFIEDAEIFFDPSENKENAYYAYREKFNKVLIHWNEKAVAQLFLYLNRHGFNGLCRFNSKGEFNVPYGKYDKPYFPKVELLHAAEVMKHTRIYHQSFTETFRNEVKAGDVVYCDPPYIPLSASSNFTAYSKEPFALKEQTELAKCAEEARDKGATVIISNNDTPLARELYKNADATAFPDVRKAISCKADGRKKSREILVAYYP